MGGHKYLIDFVIRTDMTEVLRPDLGGYRERSNEIVINQLLTIHPAVSRLQLIADTRVQNEEIELFRPSTNKQTDVGAW